jgi:hypothetical protein
MPFIQIIEYVTDQPDEIDALMLQAQNDTLGRAGSTGFERLVVTNDRDDRRRYLTIVEFASYEEAMANSDRPEVSDLAARLANLCDGPPRFHNLDVVSTTP